MCNAHSQLRYDRTYQTNISIFINFRETVQVEDMMGVNLSPYSSYKQSFNFRSVVLPEISLDEKALLIIIIHPATQLPTQLVGGSCADDGGDNNSDSVIWH